MTNHYLNAVAGLRANAAGLLSELIGFESTVGNEGPVMRYMHERMAQVADEVEFVEVTEAIKDDPDYSYPVVTTYGDRTRSAPARRTASSSAAAPATPRAR